MPIFGNISSIVASSGSIPTSSFTALPFFVADPGYGLGSTSSIAASVNLNIITQSNNGVASELTINLPSTENLNTAGQPVLLLASTGSDNQPRVGIGVAQSNVLYSILDIRSPTSSNPASLILRTNEDGVIQVGEETGRLTFAIESASYLNSGFVASGSTAAIYSKVLGTSINGSYGSLTFEINDSNDVTAPIEAMTIGYGLGATSTDVGFILSGSIQTIAGANLLSMKADTTGNELVYLGHSGIDDVPQFDRGMLLLKNDGTNLVRINDGGVTDFINTGNNLGIGTTTPSEKLSVAGNIEVTGTVDGVDVATLKSDFDTLEGKTLVSSSAQISVNELDGQFLEVITRDTAYGNGSYEGHVIKYGSGTLQALKGFIYGSSGWAGANAGAETTTKGLFGIALGSSATSDGLLVRGIHGSTAWSGFSAGDILYLDTTAGAITSTAPSTTGEFVRVIGYALGSNYIYIDPSQDYIELS